MKKFTCLYEYEPEYWIPESPVEIIKGALLKLNDELNHSKLLLQLKLCNNYTKTITSVHIIVKCFDDVNNYLYEFKYAYQDLNIYPQSTFGENVPVWIDNEKTRKVVVEVEFVKINQNVINVLGFEKKNISKRKEIKELDPDLLNELNRISLEKFGNNKIITYMPQRIDNEFWICCCGKINSNSTNVCKRCALNFKNQIDIINASYLTQSLNTYKQKLNEQLLEQKRKKKIILKFVVCIIFILLLSTGGYFFITKGAPYITYTIGKNNFENGEYQMCINNLENLLDYKDSKSFYTEACYLEGIKYIEKKDYKKALELLNKLDNYKDSNLHINKAKYIWAEELFFNGNYGETINILENITTISENELLQSSYKNYADTLMNNKNYEKALSYYEEIKSYMDVNSDIIECNYLIGVKYFSNNEYEQAQKYFESVASYKNSKEYLQQIYYNLAIEYEKRFDYDMAISNYEKSNNFKDSKEKIIVCKYYLANKYFEDKNYVRAQEIYSNLNYKDSNQKVTMCKYHRANQLLENKKYSEALKIYNEIKSYDNSEEKAKECKYQIAISNMYAGEWKNAQKSFKELSGYKDASKYITEIDIALKWAGKWHLYQHINYNILQSVYEPYQKYTWYIEIDYINKTLYSTRGMGSQFSSTGGQAKTYDATFTSNSVTANNKTYELLHDGTIKCIENNNSYYIYKK